MYKISRVAENNVEVKYSKEMTDTVGNVFLVYDEEKTESFGDTGVTQQLIEIDKQILYWQNFDEKAYKQSMLDKVKERKALLLKVRVELEK